MKTIEITANERQTVGKKHTKQLRREGKIPCVLYGGEKNVHFDVTKSNIRPLVYTPNSYLVDLKIDDATHKAVMQDIQFHPVSDEILHIDFLQIFEDKPVTIGIPVKTTGLAAGVKAGGKLTLRKQFLKVRSLYANLPDSLEVDVTDIGLGESIKVRELAFENLELLDAKNTVVATAKLTRAAKGAASTEEETTETEETTTED